MQPCKRSFTFQWVLFDPLCYPTQSLSRGGLRRDVMLSAQEAFRPKDPNPGFGRTNLSQ